MAVDSTHSRRMVAIAFLAQNMAVGMAFGACGTLVGAIEEEFATSRTLASMGVSIIALMIGLLAPAVGANIPRFGIRRIMLAGAIMCAAGYAALAVVPHIYALLAVFALLIGPGACLLGPLPASTLVSQWVAPAGQGKALGFVNMPLFVFVFPFVVSLLVDGIGMRGVFLLLAALMAAIIPLLWMIAERPASTDIAESAPVPATDTRPLATRPAFIVLALGTSLIVAAGMTMATHLVSIGQDQGLTLAKASLLLSAFGLCGAIGELLFGWFADRAGVKYALALSAFGCIPALFGLMQTGSLAPLLICAALMGLCTGPLTALQGAAVGAWLGQANFGRGMGLVYMAQVPFLFGAAPLAGYLYDQSGYYGPALALNMGTLAFAGLMFLLFRPAKAAA